MRNLLLTLCYDGAGYHGWQIQENALAVQQVLQEAIAKVLGDAPDIKGCSRTDTGVHAHQFCVSMKTEHPIPCQRLQAALNHFCPRIWRCSPVGKCPFRFTPGIPAGARNMNTAFGTTGAFSFFAGPGAALLVPAGSSENEPGRRLFCGAHDFRRFVPPIPGRGAI